MKFKELPSIERLRELFSYDEETGNLINKVTRHNTAIAGAVAGYSNKKDKGRVSVGIDNNLYPAHRIIWKLVTGEEPTFQIDHIDRDPSNNRIDNLRPATRAQNRSNTGLRKDNSSGYKGVWWNKLNQNFRAYIRVNGKNISLGSHATAEEAHAAYCVAAAEYFGEYFCAG